MSWLQKIHFLAPLTLLLMLTACAHNGRPVIASDVESYLMEMVSWKDFSPLKNPSRSPEDMSKNECSGELVNGVCEEKLQLDNAQYSCTTTKHTITDDPEKLVMYSPDVEILWPGALIQGKSYKEPGSLLGLPIRERTPIKVSIPALATEKNFTLVEHPDQAEVAQAIGSMIGDATMKDLKTPSTIRFYMKRYDSEEEFALSAGISGKYLGFSASASTDIERTASETTVGVHLYQKMYEVVVEPPQTPYHFFSPDFTLEMLQEQIELGRIHKTENIPVYVSNVVYGRMMMFTVTSTASEAKIRTALNASYRGLLAAGDVRLEVGYEKLLDEAKISITSLGGHAPATQAMIRTGNWEEYFSKDAPISSALPLSYTFRNLGDGSIAKASESTTYYLRECSLASGDYILASFEYGTEKWQTPGAAANDPNWVEWHKDRNSISGNYIKASDLEGDFYCFKAPIEGFLELLNASYYEGELSYWIRTEAINKDAIYAPEWEFYGDHIELVGRNGVRLAYNPGTDSFPEPIKYKDCAGFTKWHKLSIPLKATKTPPCWKNLKTGKCAEAETIKEVLAEVIDLRIRGEYWIAGKDCTALDEVKIVKPKTKK